MDLIGFMWFGTRHIAHHVRTVFNDCSHASEMQCSAMLHNIHDVAMREVHSPQEFYVGADSTPKDTTYPYTFWFTMCLLCALDGTPLAVIDEVLLLVGHTHTSWTDCSLVSPWLCAGRNAPRSRGCCGKSGRHSGTGYCIRSTWPKCGYGRHWQRATCQGGRVVCTTLARHMPSGFHWTTESGCSGSNGRPTRHGRSQSRYCPRQRPCYWDGGALPSRRWSFRQAGIQSSIRSGGLEAWCAAQPAGSE